MAVRTPARARLLLALTAFQVLPPHFFSDIRYAALVAHRLNLDLLEECRIDGQGQLVFSHARYSMGTRVPVSMHFTGDR